MEDLLLEWQHRLGLDNWRIALKDNCSPNDMVIKDVAGETEWEEVNKCAVIRIISQKDYGDRMLPYDKEKTLVHELLHLKFCFLGESGNDLQDRLVHQLINDMAECLVDTKRSSSGNKL